MSTDLTMPSVFTAVLNRNPERMPERIVVSVVEAGAPGKTL